MEKECLALFDVASHKKGRFPRLPKIVAIAESQVFFLDHSMWPYSGRDPRKPVGPPRASKTLLD